MLDAPVICSLSFNPADSSSDAVARLFIASLARQAALGESATEVMIGVAAVVAGAAGRDLEIELERRMDRTTVEIGPITDDELDAGDEPLRDLLEGLFDRVHCEGGTLALIAIDRDPG